MSGNSTHLGMALASAGWGDAALAGTVILAFVLGAALGTLIVDRASSLAPALVLEGEFCVLVPALLLAARGDAVAG